MRHQAQGFGPYYHQSRAGWRVIRVGEVPFRPLEGNTQSTVTGPEYHDMNGGGTSDELCDELVRR
jgi:hypothetical protein